MVMMKNWSFQLHGDPYLAPELWTSRLHGEVYNHPDPRHNDGKRVATSEILKIDLPNRKVTTISREYNLEGPPDSQWVEWLKENNLYNKYF